MEKQKLPFMQPDFDAYDHAITLEGVTIKVRRRIPRMKKEEAAEEMVTGSLIMDEELGICHQSLNAEVYHLFAALRHYTDLDVSAYETDDGMYQLYDMFRASQAYAQLFDFIREDWQEVLRIYDDLSEIVTSVFVRQHSLEYRLTGFLEDFLAVGDLTQTLAQAHEINNTLVDAFGALKEQQKAEPKLGGNVLSFARKNPDPKSE